MPRTILFPIEQRLDRRVADSVDAVIVPAERPGEALLAREFKRSTIRTIPWGVSAPSPSDRLEARRKLGLGAETLLIACVGNFTPTKGQGAVVEAVATLYPRFPSIRAVLAGDGPCRGEVRDLANHRGVADVVDLPGQLGQPWDLLRAADVFVLASEIEGLPLAVLEALSQGTPVVATNVGGMPEAVVPGVTGLLVTPHRPEQLAAALATVLSDPRLRDEMGAAARVRYEQRFTTESMLNSHERLYGDLLTSAERRKR
jgi:glycosyltransferase involved in cell wall biosynthesis